MSKQINLNEQGKVLELLNDKVVAIGLKSGTIKLWNSTNMIEMNSQNSHNEEIRAISEINSTVFASLSRDYLIFWSSNNLTLINKISNSFEGKSIKPLGNKKVLAILVKVYDDTVNIRFLDLKTSNTQAMS